MGVYTAVPQGQICLYFIFSILICLSYTKMQLWWWDFILLFELNLFCPTLRCNSGDGIYIVFLNSICFVLHLDATLVMGVYAAFWTLFVWWCCLRLLFELNLFCPTLRCNSGDGILYCCASGPDLSLFYFFYLNLFCPSLRRNSVDGILYCSLNSIWFVLH